MRSSAESTSGIWRASSLLPAACRARPPTSENTVSTTPSANSASCEIVAASQTPIAAVIICQKPTSAEAAPAFSPNGESACAVPSGLTMPMPSRNTLIAARNGRKEGLYSETSSIAMLPVAAANSPPRIERSSP